MSTIFISYAQTDRSRARPLAKFLEASGYKVWWDVGLRPGENFTTEIQRQIQKADHIVVIWSEVSVASFWVTAEVTYARTCRKPILPIRIDSCQPPVPFNLLQTLDLNSIEIDGPEIVQTLVRAGTVPLQPVNDATAVELPLVESIARKAQELARWEFIKGSEQAEDFRGFLARFPDGDLADLAMLRLESLRWEEVSKNRTIEELSAFLSEFPNGVKAPEAQRLLQRRQKALEQADWARLKGGLFSWGRKRADRLLLEYEEFLRSHPTGSHADQARATMERLRHEVELWNAAESASDPVMVARYLDEYPSGSFTPQAKAHLARLQRHALAPAAVGQSAARRSAGKSFPFWTFLALSAGALLVGGIGALLGVRGQFLLPLPVRSLSGETVYLLHPYPILIGVFVAFLIHEWGNRSWLTTAFAFCSVLAFRSVAQLMGLPEDDILALPIKSMVTGALYCFGAWMAGFIVAPYMRQSQPVFFASIVLGALCYPNWFRVLGVRVESGDLITAGIFFVACTMPIAYSLLRAPHPRPVPQSAALAPAKG